METIGTESKAATARLGAGGLNRHRESTLGACDYLARTARLARLALTPDPGNPLIRPDVQRVRERIPAVLADAMQACVNGRGRWPLFAFGPAGTGKTCAALYLCDRVAGSCVFRDFAELCEELRRAMMGELWAAGTHSETRLRPDDVWRQWTAADLAVLDEIGIRAVVSDHVFETLKAALDAREAKPLLLLSNLDLDRLAGVFDDRVASRCAAGTVVHVVGPDQRLRGTA